MRTIAVGPEGHLELRETAEPVPGRGEALVRVEAVSLNRGEVTRALSAKEGARLGWDLAGVVERAAEDGSGPAAGCRVVGLVTSKAWSDYAAVPVSALAALPDSVTFSEAACLPIAGLTALHALRRGGPLLGRRVLVTGATGGVGQFACTLARLAGAEVTALVRSAAGAETARRAGADHVAVLEDNAEAASAFGPYDLIVESVGGRSLERSVSLLASRGVCVVFGVSDSPEVSLDARALYLSGSRTLTGLAVFDEVKQAPAGRDLSLLVSLVAEGRLTPDIAVRRPWEDISAAAADLLARRHGGKAVLLVGEAARKENGKGGPRS